MSNEKRSLWATLDREQINGDCAHKTQATGLATSRLRTDALLQPAFIGAVDGLG